MSMGIIAGVVGVGGTLYSAYQGKKAADQAGDASQAQLGAQQDQLAYLQEREAMPMAYRDAAMQRLGGLFGFDYAPGADGTTGSITQTGSFEDSIANDPLYRAISGQGPDFVAQAKANPFYDEMIQSGEDAVMRNQAMTGGLRSGGTQRGLASVNQGVLQDLYNQQLQGYAKSYGTQLGGLQQFAGTQGNTNAIANAMAGLGETQAQGMLAQAQIGQDTAGSILSSIGQLGGAYLSNPNTDLSAMFSDATLKKNIQKIDEINGINIYVWEWNEKAANDHGLTGGDIGPLAQELQQTHPHIVSQHDSGHLMIDMQGYLGALYATE